MSKSEPRRGAVVRQKGLVTTSNPDGSRSMHWFDDPPPRKGGKAATPEEIAAMHARRKAYLDEYLAQKEAKRKANQSRRSA